MKIFFRRLVLFIYKVMIIVLAFFPVLIFDLFKGLRTGIRLGRLDAENDLRWQKEQIQLEMFRRSSYDNNTEVMVSGQNGYRR